MLEFIQILFKNDYDNMFFLQFLPHFLSIIRTFVWTYRSSEVANYFTPDKSCPREEEGWELYRWNESKGGEGNCTADLHIGILKIKLALNHLVLSKVRFPIVLKYVGIKISCNEQNVN